MTNERMEEMRSDVLSWIVVSIALGLTACGNGCEDQAFPDDDTGGGDSGMSVDTGADLRGRPDAGSADDAATGDDALDECVDPCSTAGATRCDGDDLYECVDDGECLAWEHSETCDDALLCSAGQCVEQCQDACSTVGARRCEGGGAGSVAECQTDANGCLVWEEIDTCQGPETCSNGACAEQCTDECSTVNERACEADGYKLCGDFDADPCLDWGDVVPCNGDATCSNGYCAVQCSDECSTSGVDACVMGVEAVHSCGDFDSDPCLEWSTTTNCNAGEECDNGACVVNDPCAGVVCDMPPADSCVDPDTARQYGATGACDGAGGCDYSYVDVHCPDGCQNGACLAPTCGGTTCDNPPADTCASSAQLTHYFPLGTCDATDACEYQSTTIECSEGCFQGDCIQGSWETEHPPLSVPDYGSMDIVFDATGNPHIAYCTEYTGDMIYRWRDARGWHEETVDPGLGYTQQSQCEVAIGLDAQGRPMIAYHDPTNQDLRFARLEGGAWSLDLVATSGFVGRAPSVSVSPSGEPTVAFADVTNQELKLSTYDGTNWQTETIDSWGAYADPITEMRWSRTDDLHVLAGASRSVATSQGNYDQPEVFLHTRSGGSWQHTTVHEDGFVNRDGIALTPGGDVLVQVGAVLSVGASDQVRVVRVDGGQIVSDRLVRYISNLLYVEPVGVFNTDSMTEVITQDESHYRLDDHGYWSQRTTPADGQGRVYRVNWTLGDDTFRLLRGAWRITEPSACTPQCSGRACGNDGCGGSCGSCAATESCDPLGQCTTWRYETPDVWLGDTMLAAGTDELHTFGYNYDDGGMSYSTNASGDWTVEATGMDPSPDPNAYGPDGAAMDSAGSIHVATLQPRPTHYNAWDKIEVFSFDGAGWTSTIVGQLFRANLPVQFQIDGDDAWHFAFSEKRYPDYSGSQLAYGKYENGTWEKEVLVTPEDPYNRGNGRATNIQLAVDSAGNAHILWIQTLTYTSQVSLHYATNESGAWVDEALVDPYDGGAITMAIDGTDTLHVAYRDGAYNTPGHYGTLDPGTGSWTWEDGPLSIWDQFGLDPQGTPFFADTASDAIEIHRRQAVNDWSMESIPARSPGGARILFDDASHTHVIYTGGGGDAQSQTRHVWQ